jgi:hypothetical protein
MDVQFLRSKQVSYSKDRAMKILTNAKIALMRGDITLEQYLLAKYFVLENLEETHDQ